MDDTLEKLIAKNKIPQAIKKLHQISEYDRDLEIETIQISARYEEYLSQSRLGLSDAATSKMELAKIRAALLDIGNRVDEPRKAQFSLPTPLKNPSKKLLSIILIAALILVAGYFVYGYFAGKIGDNSSGEAAKLPVINNETGIPVNASKPNGAKTFSITYYNNETEAHPDIENDIITSKKAKLYLVRGKRLFNEQFNGLFCLEKYNNINPYFNSQVLLLDFDNLSLEQYNKMKKNVSLRWTNYEEDKETKNLTLKTINHLENKGFGFEVRNYDLSDFQYFKMFIFDDHCYFTIYHRIGSAEHQKYQVIKAYKDDPLYKTMELIFDTSWDEAH